jgi:hypothetical protein
MSNVLIGIIGVILFIGLALAGALFLGPRFQESSNSSRAAALSQSVFQVASAIEMYELQEGVRRTFGSIDDLVPGYLKSIPHEVGSGAGGSMYLSDRAFGLHEVDGDDPRRYDRFVVSRIGGSNPVPVCHAMNQQAGHPDRIVGDPSMEFIGRTGCVKRVGDDYEYYAYYAI